MIGLVTGCSEFSMEHWLHLGNQRILLMNLSNLLVILLRPHKNNVLAHLRWILLDLNKIFGQILLKLNPVLSTSGEKGKSNHKKITRVDLATLSKRGMTGASLVI